MRNQYIPGSDLCIPRNETARPPKHNYKICLPRTCVCEWFIYSQDFAAAKEADRSLKYLNHLQIEECTNWERGHSVSFLGMHYSDIWYSVAAPNPSTYAAINIKCRPDTGVSL